MMFCTTMNKMQLLPLAASSVRLKRQQQLPHRLGGHLGGHGQVSLNLFIGLLLVQHTLIDPTIKTFIRLVLK